MPAAAMIPNPILMGPPWDAINHNTGNAAVRILAGVGHRIVHNGPLAGVDAHRDGGDLAVRLQRDLEARRFDVRLDAARPKTVTDVRSLRSNLFILSKWSARNRTSCTVPGKQHAYRSLAVAPRIGAAA